MRCASVFYFVGLCKEWKRRMSVCVWFLEEGARSKEEGRRLGICLVVDV